MSAMMMHRAVAHSMSLKRAARTLSESVVPSVAAAVTATPSATFDSRPTKRARTSASKEPASTSASSDVNRTISAPSSLRVMTCKRPAFSKQEVYTKTGTYVLTDGHSATAKANLRGDSAAPSAAAATSSVPELPSCVVLVRDVLSASDRAAFVDAALRVERRTGRSAFGMKPRAEVCYTSDGKPYKYSGKLHYTTQLPPHVRSAIPLWLAALDERMPGGARNPYRRVSHAVDILYGASFSRGGSIGRHKDDEMDGWGLVMVYTLGQTRWLRVRHEQTGAWHNVEASDNSLIAMLGPRFQKDYTHQVDKLAEGEEVGARLSINVRLLQGDTDEEQAKDDNAHAAATAQ